MVKPIKNDLQNQNAYNFEIWHDVALSLKFSKVNVKDNHAIDFDLFYSKVNFGNLCFNQSQISCEASLGKGNVKEITN